MGKVSKKYLREQFKSRALELDYDSAKDYANECEDYLLIDKDGEPKKYLDGHLMFWQGKDYAEDSCDDDHEAVNFVAYLMSKDGLLLQ